MVRKSKQNAAVQASKPALPEPDPAQKDRAAGGQRGPLRGAAQ